MCIRRVSWWTAALTATILLCVVVSEASIVDVNKCNANRPIAHNVTLQSPIRQSIKLWQSIVLLLCIGAFALFICLIHKIIRTYVYYDAHLVDTYFDGGGDTNASLVAVAVISRLVWPFTFSQPLNDMREVGVVGGFWFAAGLVIHLFLFSIVAAEIRIKAPGAKTFLQVLYARFGAGAHVVVMIFAFICNVIVVGMVMLEGTRVMVAVTQGLSNEVACILIVVVVCFFTLVGGVGGSMYVAYFMTSLVLSVALVFSSEVFFDPLKTTAQVNTDLGSVSALYRRMDCGMVRLEQGNEQNSPLTFVSRGGMMNGVLLILAGFSSIFVNQSFWQAGMTAKPGHAVWGFITGGLAWFAIPFTASFGMGAAYWALSVRAGDHTVHQDHAKAGMLPMYVAQTMMGTTGTFLMLVITLAAVICTASAQILSTSSLIIYDIYQTYISPFRASPVPEDKQMSVRMQRAIHNEEYLEYDRRSMWLKHVVVVTVSVLLIPITLVMLQAKVDVYWLFMVTGIICGGSVVPVAFSITWHRTTCSGVTSGALSGFVAGLVLWLSLSAVEPGGLANFRASTSAWRPLVVGLSSSLGLGAVLCVLVSISCGGCDSGLVEEEEWEKTRQIDNPILPWAVKYAPDIGATNMVKGRPHFYTVRRTFKGSEICAYMLGVLLAVCTVLIWPAAMLPTNVFTEGLFTSYVYLALIWGAVATAFVILVPFVWEIVQNCRQAYYNRLWAHPDSPIHGRLEEDTSASEVHPDMSYRRGPQHNTALNHDAREPGPSEQYMSNHVSEIDEAGPKERWKTFIHLE